MDMFSALAEPTRRNIVELLAKKGTLSATSISDNFSITPQAISQHLKVLRDAEVIKVEKRAQQRLYQINPKKVQELEEWIKKLTEMWDRRFNMLDRLLEEEKKKLKK
jgi:DNA-binding transcriptional ArsR family regulator